MPDKTKKFENAESVMRLTISQISRERGLLFDKFIEGTFSVAEIQKMIKANRCLAQALEELKK